MKILLTLLFTSFITMVTGQSAIGIQGDLRGLAVTNLQVGTTAITTFSSPNVKGSQYLFDSWTSGSVTDEERNTYSINYTFNFDKINHNLYALHGGEGGISVLIEKAKIAGFTIGNKNYVSARYIKGADSKTLDRFYQVLVKDTAKISLYKLTVTKFVKANTSDILAVKTGNMSSEYVDNNTYFVSVKNGDIKKINITEAGIYKALKEYDAKIETYSNKNMGRDVDEQYVVDIIRHLNAH